MLIPEIRPTDSSSPRRQGPRPGDDTLDSHLRGNNDLSQLRLPPEFRKNLRQTSERRKVHEILRSAKLNTVCEEARCPNIGECFSNKTATFMILGDRCTRRCHFCSVKTARPSAPDAGEPDKLVEAVVALGLDHIVITSVDRDDLPDCGASHFAKCIVALRQAIPNGTIELLTPDFKGQGALLDIVLDAQPHVFGHNIETVEHIYQNVRPQSRFKTSVSVLEYVASQSKIKTKSGMMVGLGETDTQVDDTLRLLKELGVKIVTIGQYLRPSLKHWPVHRYVEPASYSHWMVLGRQLGFDAVFAGPFVRSSYHAKETFIQSSVILPIQSAI